MRFFSMAFVFFFCFIQLLTAQEKYITVTDLADRTVKVKENPSRVILGMGRMVYTIALLDRKDPFKRIIAWQDDLKYDPDTYHKYEQAFPKIKDIKIIGKGYNTEWNLETLISLDPDLVILSLSTFKREKESGILKTLEKAKIDAVFIDNRLYPTINSIRSVHLLGRIFDRQAQAEEFSRYYVKETERVYEGLEKRNSKKPLVFLEAAAGWSDTCCSTFGSRGYGRFIELGGARNWGSEKSTNPRLRVSFEALLSDPPDLIVGTGANWSQANPSTTAVLLGYSADEPHVQQRLHNLAARPGWDEFKAVKERQFYTIFHQFGYGPYHFVAIQALAKWSYPDLFPDLDPAATLKELHEKFLPIEYSGIFLDKLE